MNLDDDVITNASRIIILKLEEKGTIGIIVDEVKEVVTLCTDEIDKTSGSKDGKSHVYQWCWQTWGRTDIFI